jgi:hypothetical protein
VKRSVRVFVALLLSACGAATPRPASPSGLPPWALEISERISAAAGGAELHQGSKDLDALYAEAQAADAELHRAVDEVAKETGGTAVFPPGLKGRERATEKINADYGGDASRLFDITRATIEYESVEKLYHGLDKISTRLVVVRLKDRFAKPLESGYRDILMNVRMPNGHIGEVQLHLKQILAVKEEEHKGYEVVRSLEATAHTENRELTAEEKQKIDELTAAAKKMYDAAFKKALEQ